MNEEKLPTSLSVGDYAHLAVKIGLGSLVPGGGAAAELFGALMSPPLERRKQVFIQDVVDRIAELEAAGRGNFEDLPNNESFVTAVAQAVPIALRTHEQEKLEALRNAVCNSASGISITDVEQQIFLRYVDELSGTHIRVLQYGFDRVRPRELDFGGWLDASPALIIGTVFPEFAGNEILSNRIWDDLVERSLVKWSTSSSAQRSASYWRDQWTTDFGNCFLQFIAAPSTDCPYPDLKAAHNESPQASSADQSVKYKVAESVRDLARTPEFKDRILNFNNLSSAEQRTIADAVFHRTKMEAIPNGVIEFVLQELSAPRVDR